MTEFLKALLPLLTAALILVLVMAVSHSVRKSRKDEAFIDRLQEVTRSEFHQDEEVKASSIFDWTNYWYQAAISAGEEPESKEAPGRKVMILALLGLGIGALLLSNIFVGVIIALVTVGLMRIVYSQGKSRRAKKMDKQLPALISSMRQNLQSNFTPQQAILAVVDDTPAPLGKELQILRDEVSVNVPLAVALRNLANRVGSREMQFLIASIEIASVSGSDLDPQLKIIQDILVKRSRIASKLATAVASVQPTIWIAAVLIPAGLVFSFTGDSTNAEFWGTLTGIICLIVIGVLYLAGIFISIHFAKKIEKM